MSSESAVNVIELTKTFTPVTGWRPRRSGSDTVAVDRVSLRVAQGELFGLLGPNGAGKTTLVKMLSTLILPTSGRAIVAGYSLNQAAQIRRAVGLVVSDERSFYWRLSGRQNMEFFASMYSLTGDVAQRRIDHLLEEVDLKEAADQPFRNYSSGMRQRLAIARSLLHQPQVLFLDEPSRSLDPVATIRLHRLIRQLAVDQEVTIFLITHDLTEAEKLCRRVAVMHQGQIQVIGPPAELRRRLRPHVRYTARVTEIPSQLQDDLEKLLPGGIRYPDSRSERQFSFQASEDDGILSAVLDLVRRAGIEILMLESHLPSLEEVFAHYTGQESPNSPLPENLENETLD